MKAIYFNISCFGCRKLKAMQERRLAWVSPDISGREGLKPCSFASQFSSLATVQWCSKDSWFSSGLLVQQKKQSYNWPDSLFLAGMNLRRNNRSCRHFLPEADVEYICDERKKKKIQLILRMYFSIMCHSFSTDSIFILFVANGLITEHMKHFEIDKICYSKS